MITIGPGVYARTLAVFRSCGQGQRECVAYWVGPADDPSVVDDVVHPVHDASPGHYELDDAWLTTFWLNLAAQRKSVRVQVHTHEHTAFHSFTDDKWPLVHQEGFLSLVVPEFGFAKDATSGLFLAELIQVPDWREVAPQEFLRGLR